MSSFGAEQETKLKEEADSEDALGKVTGEILNSIATVGVFDE